MAFTAVVWVALLMVLAGRVLLLGGVVALYSGEVYNPIQGSLMTSHLRALCSGAEILTTIAVVFFRTSNSHL